MDPKTIGRYEIIDELGRGAMGSVFRARDPIMGRTVALKCILSAALAGDQTNEYRLRFYREARAAGALAHPGIVPVFDVGEDDGTPYIVMELVQGRTLGDAIKLGERYSLEQVCEIGRQIADALGHAHRNGVVHRDIKPANILMTSREIYGAERPRITDFGVAKLAGGEITSTGQLLGTPAFMPPEQFTGAPIDGRTDLFSLGVILYRMATGEQPFSGETITAVSYKIVHTDPIPPSRLNPGIGPGLEAALLKSLAKNPANRYQTGEEMAVDLAAVSSAGQASMLNIARAPAMPAGYDPGATVDVVSRSRIAGYPAPPSQLQPGAPQPQQAAPQWTMPPGNPAAVPISQQFGQQTGQQFAPAIAQPTPQAPRPAAPAPAPMRPPPAQPAPITRSAPRDESSLPSMTSGTIRTHRTLPLERQEKPKKRGVPILVWLIVAGIALVGTRYLLQLRVDPKTQQLASDSSQPAASAPAAPSAASTSPVPVDFNPRGLDPSRSGRLRVDLGSLPSAAVLEIQIDGQRYWSGTAGSAYSDSGFVVAPGRHEIHILSYAGVKPIESSSVRADFVANKRFLLTAQVRPQPAPGAGTLEPGSNVTLSIRADAFGF
ncbi:MAG TPA: serine/threonine-protein kinase [Terracidiphilus sp.]|jgi:serine/threonine-protein kinase|nr:serine/threonine-protein kinase [Terracidiphilus sp.]